MGLGYLAGHGTEVEIGPGLRTAVTLANHPR